MLGLNTYTQLCVLGACQNINHTQWLNLTTFEVRYTLFEGRNNILCNFTKHRNKKTT